MSVPIGDLALVAGVGLAAVLSPGPDFLITARNALKGGRAAGVATACGIALALTAHVAVGVFGLSLLLTQSATLFFAVKLAGAGYLLFIGVQAMRARPMAAREDEATPNDDAGAGLSLLQAFRMGVLTNLLNPKAMLFFIALFTQVIAAETPRVWKAVFGAAVMGEALLWFSIVALLLSTPRLRMAYWGVGHWIDRAAGLAFAGFGLGLLFTHVRETL